MIFSVSRIIRNNSPLELDSMYNFKGQYEFDSTLPERHFAHFRGFAAAKEQKYCVTLLHNSICDEWDRKRMSRIWEIKPCFWSQFQWCLVCISCRFAQCVWSIAARMEINAFTFFIGYCFLQDTFFTRLYFWLVLMQWDSVQWYNTR